MARQREKSPNGEDPFNTVKHKFRRTGPPKVLFIGSSHVARLAKFSSNRYTPLKYGNMLSRSEFMGVGGVKWHNLETSLNGNPPPEKAHLDHLWSSYHNKNFHPNYVVLMVGSNDVDDFGTYCDYLRCTINGQDNKRDAVAKTMTDWYNALELKVESFLNDLQLHIPGCIIKYIPIINHPWWDLLTNSQSG